MLVAGNRNCPQCGSAVDLSKITAQLSKPGLASTSDADWDGILARVQQATLGELHFIAPLGRGGMAAVYLAEDIRLRRKVAVKMILPELMADERMVRRFQEEASTVANLRHANIVRVFAVREAAGIHFFTMDYIEGCSLEAILETSGPLPIPVVRSVLGQVASALGNAHRQGVFHRDVKPANILIDTEGNAYVTDFGIAKVSKSIGKSKTLTQFGAVVGTPAYISPEQCLSRPVTSASDQYSLGVVAYELVAGHPPFDDQNTFALMRSHTDEPVPPLRQRRSACPPELEAAILRMLSKKPEDRFGSMGEAIAALEATPLPEDSPLRTAFAELAVPILLPPDSNTPPIDNKVAELPTERVKDPARPTVAMIGISPPPDVVDVGDRLTLIASTRDMGGVTLPNMKVTWHSSDERIATIDAASGEVHAMAVGTAELSATVGRARATVMFTVEARGASSIEITPLASPVQVGDTPQLSATVRDRKGAITTDLPVTWRSGTPKVAMVSASGLMEGTGAGEAEIIATSGDVSASYRVQVRLQPAASIKLTVPDGPLTIGDSFRLVARVFDAKGALLTGRSVALMLDDDEIATLGQDGMLAAKGPGTVHVIATCEAVRLASAVTIQPAPVHAVQLASPPASMCEGDTFVLAAIALDAQGRSLTGRAMRWSSQTPELAAVSSTGAVEAIAPGTARITCTIENKSVTVTVVVKQQPVVALQISPPPKVITIGDSFRLMATPADKHGAHLVGRTTEWRTDNPAIASVNAAGLVTANAIGAVKVSATCEAASASVPIEVAPAPVTSVSVTGLPGSLDVGKHAQVRATSVDKRGNPVERGVVWTSTAPAVATVSATGDVAALTAGQTRIVAQVEGIESATELTVNRKIIGSTPRPASAENATPQLEQLSPVTHPSRKQPKAGNATATDLPGLYPTEQPFQAPEGGEAAEARKKKAEEADALGKQREEVEAAARAASVARAETARKQREEVEARSEAERKQRLQRESRAEVVRKESEQSGKLRAEQAAVAQKKAMEEAQATERDAAERKKGLDLDTQKDGQVAPERAAKAGRAEQERDKKADPKKSVAVAAIAAGVVIVLAGAAFALKYTSKQTTGTVPAAAIHAQRATDSMSTGGAPVPSNTRTAPAVRLPVAEVKLSGVPSQVIVGDAFQVVGTALAKGGVVISGGRPVTYASSDARVASVDAAGHVVAASGGRVTISASSDGVTTRESFVVAAKTGKVETTVRLVMTAPPPIRVGESAPVRATASPAGTSLNGLAWTSSNESVARVDAHTGQVTGVSRGKAIISARLGKVTQGDEVEVLPAEVVDIQVPSSHTLKESESARLTATPTDRQGQPLRGRDISWSSDRPQVVSVSDDGVITGRSGGSATVTATSEGRVGRVAVRVEAKPVPVAPPVVVRNDPPPIPTRDVGAEANTAARAAAVQQLSARPAEVLQAISTRDVNRAATLFSTEFAEDQRNAGGLRDKLSRPEAELKATDLQAGSPQMSDSEGTLDFRMRLTWITAVGREKSAIVNFQARTQRTSAGWRFAGVKVLNEVK